MRIPFYFAVLALTVRFCHPAAPTPPPAPPLDTWAGDCRAVYHEELGDTRTPGPQELMDCEQQMAAAVAAGQNPAQDVFRAWLRTTPEWHALHDHVNPAQFSLDQLAKVRGAMWTARLTLPYGPRPGQPSNLLPFVYYHLYDTLDRQRMINVYRAQGYTHAVSGPITGNDCYHSLYPCLKGLPSQAQWDEYLDELQVWWDHGLVPIVFIHPDGWSFEQTRDFFTSLLHQPKAQRVIRVVVPAGWEPARYEWSSCTWALYMQWARNVLPNALVAIHTVTDVDAPVGVDGRCNDNTNPNGNGDGWARVAPFVHLWLIQNGPYTQHPRDNPSLAKEFGDQFRPTVPHSIAWHFAGNAGWPTSSAWGAGRPIRLIAAEQTSYEATWRDLAESISRAWGDVAMAAGAGGYLDGGTQAVP